MPNVVESRTHDSVHIKLVVTAGIEELIVQSWFAEKNVVISAVDA